MTKIETADNILYIAMLQHLKQAADSQKIDAQRYALIKKELERRVRPTIISPK